MGGQQGTLSLEVPAHPLAGKPITVVVRSPHTGDLVWLDEYRGCLLTTGWTVGHVHKILEVKLRVHRNCQRLIYDGMEAVATDTLHAMIGCDSHRRLPSKVMLRLDLCGMDQFPEKLMSFGPAIAPLGDVDLERPKGLPPSTANSWSWTLRRATQRYYGVTSKSERVKVHVSPLRPLTLDALSKAKFCVPHYAEHFAFSYPTVHLAEAGGINPFELSDWQTSSINGCKRVLDVLRVGAFLFFNGEGRIVAVNTLSPQVSDGAALHFAKPRPWFPQWTKALAASERFQPLTMKVLRDVGARLFVWLYPGELLLGADGSPLASQPQVPHGGFAYLFHEDLAATDEEDLCLDRYFAVTQALDKPDWMEGLEREASRFEVVGLEPAAAVMREPPVSAAQLNVLAL